MGGEPRDRDTAARDGRRSQERGAGRAQRSVPHAKERIGEDGGAHGLEVICDLEKSTFQRG